MGETLKPLSSVEDTAPLLDDANATRSEVVHEWANSSSIDGLDYIFDIHSRPWKRFLFFILFCVCLGLLTWNLSVVINTYLQYKTTTSIQTIAPKSLVFPDITVCNINPFQASLVNATGITSPKNDEELNQVTQPLEEFIISTKFGEEDLNVTDYWTQTNTDAGPCWTFHTDSKISRPGATDGLVFAAFIYRENYYKGADVEGTYMYITEANTTTITIERPFTDLGPGLVHTVYLDVTKFDREADKPWSTCVKTPESFSQPACRAECYFDYQIETCGCRGLGDNRRESLVFDYCASDFNDFSDGDCLVIPETLDCSCPDPPCKETVYGVRTSALQLSQTRIRSIAVATGTDEEFIRNNIVFAQINFEAIRRQDVTETKAVTLSGLLAAIGGLFGFFIGVSVFSFADAFDLCFLRLLPRSWGDRRLYGVGSRVSERRMDTIDDQNVSSVRSSADIDEAERGGLVAGRVPSTMELSKS